MKVDNTKCSDANLLRLLGADENNKEATEISEHVQHCENCQHRIEELAASDDDWDEAGTLLAATANSNGAGHSGKRASASRWNARPVAWTESMAQQLLSPPSHPEMMGRIGRYEVERLIGSGGMGVVFKAFDTELNRPVAVKVLAPYLSGSGAARKRFAREARAAAAVVHEHVVPIHNVETERETPFLVMQYIAGESLQGRIDREGALDVCEILRIGMQVACGLAAAHAQGLVHRDIKPSNILLEQGVERALITDFGLARAADDASLTHTGFHPGTPQYMSPEQATGVTVDSRSDLFSLGSVLYTMCTGRPPFRAETSYGVLRRITDDEARPIREINPNIPPWLCTLISTLMAKQADDRYRTAEEVAELLEKCLAHVQQPTTTPLPESVAKLVRSFGASNKNESAESLDDFRFIKGAQQRRYPPFVKWVAAAAFGCLLILAGVLIVLELNKGTLTIECDADDVPIRIMQGDDVVERLTVTRSGERVRIAAGDYVVVIDGLSDGMTVSGGTVSLQRQGTEIVRIVRTGASIDDSAAPAGKPNQSPHFAVSEAESSPGRKSLNHRITVDIYGGSDVLPQMNTRGANKAKHTRLIQDLNAIKGVTTNFREAGAGNTIFNVIIRDPSMLCRQESIRTGQPSEVRKAIEAAMKTAGVASVRWEEGSQTEQETATPVNLEWDDESEFSPSAIHAAVSELSQQIEAADDR